MSTIASRITGVLIGLAVAVVIVAIAIAPFLTPAWVGFEQERAQSAAWTGFTPNQLRTVTNALLADLVIGPPDFDVAVDGMPTLNDREQGHMRDVRSVFAGLYLLAAISAVGLIVASRRRERAATWRSVRRGASGLAVVVIVVGVIGLVAFDQLFTVFHELFFPAGSYLFDPTTDRLVQLFPFQFWQETAMVAGVVIIAIALVVALVAGRRSAAAAGVAERTGTDLRAMPESGG